MGLERHPLLAHAERLRPPHVPGADWTTNIYHPVWGDAPAFIAPHISKTKLRLASYGLADTMSFAEDRVQLTLGVRRQQVISDTYNIKTGDRTSRYDESATTPAAAILVKVTDRVSVYANYIEGLSQGATAPMTAANAGDVFAPYKTKQKEIGLKLDLGDFAHTVSLYEIKRPNGYTDPYTNVFSFGGEQRNRGVEWSFFGTPWTGLRLMGGVAYVDPSSPRPPAASTRARPPPACPSCRASWAWNGTCPPCGLHAHRQRNRRDQAVHQRRQLAVGAGTRGL